MTDLVRGALVTFGARGEFTGKPRPGLIVQRGTTLPWAPTITICGLTSKPTEPNSARIQLLPSDRNGLRGPSFVMVDKIVSISRGRIGAVIGVVEQHDLEMIDLALRRWLDL